MIAVMILGGPFAAALVAIVGTTDHRELRGEVPWYGTLFNHASAATTIVLGGAVYEIVVGLVPQDPVLTPIGLLVAALLASAVFILLGWAFAAVAAAARSGVQLKRILFEDIGGIAVNFAGLAPVGWLMAQVFQLPNGVGWWATPLFAVPLFTTRLAYARYVETRELFEQTIEALSKAVDARDTYTRNHSSRVSHIA